MAGPANRPSRGASDALENGSSSQLRENVMAGAAPAPLRWWLGAAPSKTLEALVHDLDAELRGPRAGARPRAGRKRFYRIEPAAAGERALYVKIFQVEPGLPRLTSVARPSKAQREQNVARLVRDRGFDAVVPIAVGESRRVGFLARSVVVSEERPGKDLRSLLAAPGLPGARKTRLLERFADLTRRMHDAGVDQDDTSPNNFLANETDGIALLDFERCAVGSPLERDRRLHLLAKLHRHDLGVGASRRLRFLARYLGPGASREELHRVARDVVARLLTIRQRDARRAAASAFRIGRHVGRRDGERGEEWFVKGRSPEGERRLATTHARELWIRAHQLERLALPAPRPISLDSHGVVLSAAHGPACPPDQTARLRRRFELFGAFSSPPRFVQTDRGPVLADLMTFQVRD